MAIAGNFNHVEIWNPDNLEDTFNGPNEFDHIAHDGDIWDLAFSPDGKTLVTAGEDGLAKRWRVADQRIDETWDVWPTNNVLGLGHDILHNGNTVAISFADGVWVYDRKRHVLVAYIKLPIARSSDTVRISPNGQYLAIRGEGKPLTVMPLRGEGDPISLGSPALEYGGLAFSHDSAMIFVSEGNSTVIAYNVERSAEAIEVFSSEARFKFNNLGCSPDGRWLLAGDSISENAAFLFDLVESRQQMLIEGFDGDHAFSADGQLLATTSTDGSIRIWDVEEGTLRHSLVSQGQLDGFLAFSPDNKLLASANTDYRLRFWSVELGEELLGIPIAGESFGIAFSEDGETLITGIRYHAKGNKHLIGRFLSYSAPAPTAEDTLKTEP